MYWLKYYTFCTCCNITNTLFQGKLYFTVGAEYVHLLVSLQETGSRQEAQSWNRFGFLCWLSRVTQKDWNEEKGGQILGATKWEEAGESSSQLGLVGWWFGPHRHGLWHLRNGRIKGRRRSDSSCGQMIRCAGPDRGERERKHVMGVSVLLHFPSERGNAGSDSYSLSRALSPVSSTRVLFHPSICPSARNSPLCVVLGGTWKKSFV